MEKNLLQPMQLNFVPTPADDATRANTKSPKEEEMKLFVGFAQIHVATAVGPEA